MSFSRPSLTDLVRSVESDFAAASTASSTRLPATLQNIFARALAGGLHGLYGYLDTLSRQILPDTADGDFLARHAAIWGVARTEATTASGLVTFTGSAGAVIPAGTLATRSDNMVFSVQSAVTLSATGTAEAQLVAATAGEAGNCAAGETFSLQKTIAGVGGRGSGAAFTGGNDAESDASLLERVLARIRQPPHGGAAFDYVSWAREIAGVTRVWVAPQYNGPGTVAVTFVCDERDSIIPTSDDVEQVRQYIESQRPVTACGLTVFAPLPSPIDFSIAILSGDTADTRAAILANLQDLFSREAAPAATILLSHLREAISQAAGEMNHSLQTPTADIEHPFYRLPVLGSVTFVS